MALKKFKGMTPAEIWPKLSDLQQRALRWLADPVGQRNPNHEPYYKTLGPLVGHRLVRWGEADLAATHSVRDHSQLTDLGREVLESSKRRVCPATTE